MHQFTPSDLYRFDLQGFLVIPNVIPQKTIDYLNEIIDRHTSADTSATIRVDHILDKEPVFRSLLEAIDLSPLFGGTGSRYRLDHDYLQVLRQGRISRGLHGGATPHDPAQAYTVKDGRIHCGLVGVAVSLVDAPAEYGGFNVISGSHQSNFAPVDNCSGLTQVIGCEAGGAIVFTETLRHGTSPWNSDTERRTMFLKFSPINSAYSSQRYSFDHPLVKEPAVW